MRNPSAFTLRMIGVGFFFTMHCKLKLYSLSWVGTNETLIGSLEQMRNALRVVSYTEVILGVGL